MGFKTGPAAIGILCSLIFTLGITEIQLFKVIAHFTLDLHQWFSSYIELGSSFIGTKRQGKGALNLHSSIKG